MPRPRLTKIPEKFFSKGFLRLSPRKQIALRNRLKLESVSIYAKANNLVKDVGALNERIAEAKLTSTKIEGGTAKAERELSELLQRERNLKKAISSFGKRGRLWFTEFEPDRSGKHTSENSVETTVHTAWQLAKLFEVYIRNADRGIKLLKSK